MYLLVGLGNPGKSYSFNRHNVGFIILDKILNYFSFDKLNDKFKAEFFKGQIAEQKILAIKPQTYMNASGEAISLIANFYKISPENIIVIYDDLDIDLGNVKLVQGGSAAGHNGIKSINNFIKNEYFKLRIGISHPGHKDEVSHYVLSDFNKEELQQINKLSENIVQKLPIFISEGREKFLNDLAKGID